MCFLVFHAGLGRFLAEPPQCNETLHGVQDGTLTLDVTSQKWIYAEEMANPPGYAGLNQSGQTAGKDHALHSLNSRRSRGRCPPTPSQPPPTHRRCRGWTASEDETGRKSCHNSLSFGSRRCSGPERRVARKRVQERNKRESGGLLVSFLVVVCFLSDKEQTHSVCTPGKALMETRRCFM